MKDFADPLDEAKIYLAYGRRAKAIHLLESAIQLQPSRDDLKELLAFIYSHEGQLNGVCQTALSKLQIVCHTTVAWILCLATLALPWLALFELMDLLVHTDLLLQPLRGDLPFALLLLVLALIVCILFTIFSLMLFTFLWFQYLKWAVGLANVSSVEVVVGRSIAFYNMEPIYSKVKKRVLHL
jgi:hypothetical protein